MPFSTAILTLCVAVALVAQTRVDPPKNSFKIEDDVKLGQEAAAQAEKELPILRDDAVDGYIDGLGQRLENAIPQRFDYPQFRYEFTPVNLKEINAFALPGGPMFVNRGMIEAAGEEGEVVGVMAHEMAHVLLRHGTAQATKAQKFQVGAVAGAIAGAIIGGNVGQVISQGTQFGLGAYFMKYSREYEKQADILGAQLMAQAGYDPRDLATMFQRIEKQGGNRAPQWLSDHPNPGNRAAYITQEAQALQVRNPIQQSARFDQVKSHLNQLAPALTAEQAARRSTTGNGGGEIGTISERVEPPSSRYRTVRPGNVFQANVPTNWQEYSSTNAVKYAPQGGFGRAGQQVVFTHGVEFGMARTETRDLREATNALLDSFARSNPQLRVSGGAQQWNLSGGPAITTALQNVSDVTGDTEDISVTTSLLQDGTLFYILTVAPDRDIQQFSPAFDRVIRSVRLPR